MDYCEMLQCMQLCTHVHVSVHVHVYVYICLYVVANFCERSLFLILQVHTCT